MCLETKDKKMVSSQIRRRNKRDKDSLSKPLASLQRRPLRKSKSLQKHGKDAPSGGIEALLPSFIGLAILVCGVMAKMGFRGRAAVAGIDLGTTNSVICVQAPSKSVGEIQCIPDPLTNSPIIPSVVSFLELSERPAGKKSKVASNLDPHPSHVVVGTTAKRRINTHPHHTLYNAKRVLGRDASHEAVVDLRNEVEFGVDVSDDGVLFRIPHQESKHSVAQISMKPQQVGSYVVNYLIDITKEYLGHEMVKSAVICVPAKFDARQRQETVEAFKNAGVSVTRILEEPTAAALAYGLHKKEGVEYILVYDFGGGTLDVSLLHVTEGFADVMGSDGDDQLGGTDFDAAVAHYLLEQRGGQADVDRVHAVLDQLATQLPGENGNDLEEILVASCPMLKEKPLCTVSSFHTIGEQLKIGLSAYADGGGTVEVECFGLPEDGDATDMESFCKSLESVPLVLTSLEYKEVVDPLYERALIPVTRLLEDLGIGREEIDEVVMVGGTTRIPEIRRRVQEVLGESTRLNTSIDPDITVAYGAASVID